MSFLQFDPKPDGCPAWTPLLLPKEAFEADVYMGQAIVRGEENGETIHAQGSFGHHLLDKSNVVNYSLFRSPSTPLEKPTILSSPSYFDSEPSCSNLVEPLLKKARLCESKLENEDCRNVDEPNGIETKIQLENIPIDEDESSKFVRPQVKKSKKDVRNCRTLNDEARKWESLIPVDRRLRLSPEETLYLHYNSVLTVFHKDSEMDDFSLWNYFLSQYGNSFVKRYLLYRTLRDEAWVPRTGQTFGCEYLVYKWGPHAYHATAGVKLSEGEIDPFELVALNRALFNVKKSLFVATVEIPENISLEDVRIIEESSVKIVATSTFFPGRERE